MRPFSYHAVSFSPAKYAGPALSSHCIYLTIAGFLRIVAVM